MPHHRVPTRSFRHAARLAAITWMALVASAGVAACRQIVGVGDPKATSGDGADAGVPSRCYACTRLQCAAALETCAADAACAERHSCLEACADGDQACMAACLADVPNFHVSDLVTDCQAQQCAAECGMSCGGWRYRTEGCDACMSRECCAELSSCHEDPGCTQFEGDFRGCAPGDRACYSTLYFQSEPSARTSAEMHVCMRKACAEECGDGQAWACVGKTHWLEADIEPFTIAGSLWDLEGVPVANATLRACYGAETCVAVGGEATSGADGQFELPIVPTPGSSRFGGRIDVEAEGRVSVQLQFSPGISGSVELAPLIVPSWEQMETLAGWVDQVAEPSMGFIVAELHDCAWAPARGVSVSIPEWAGQAVYTDDEKPVTAATATTADGVVILPNVPAGFRTLEVTSHTGQLVQSEVFFVLPESLTYLFWYPE